MSAADSFDNEPLVAPEGDGDPSLRTAGRGGHGPEPAGAPEDGAGRDFPAIAASPSEESAPDPADSVEFLLAVDPTTPARESSSSRDCLGEETGRTAVVPPSGPTVAKPYDPAAPVLREWPVPVIDGYEILGELGRGGMGVVYQARQTQLNRMCALKMILGGAHSGPASAARFLAEARAIAHLQHPHIVQIHHVGQASGLPYFELEYVDGGSLDRTLDGTPWPAQRAARLVEPLVRAVAEAHRLGIVHRDLKPGNILLTADGTPRIADFGLAKSLDVESGLTATDSIMGSPSYMAPEQAEGKASQVGPLADVYALGAIFYELLAGRPPFRGATVLESLEHVKTTEPVPPSRLVPGLPRDVETIALKCLEKEPERRYDSAVALADDLRRFLRGEPIIARPVPPWERAFKWARRRPVIAALVVAVVVLLASLLGLGIWSYAEINRSLTTAERLAETEARANRRAQEQTKLANQRAEDLAWEDYVNRVNRAYGEVQDDNIALAEDLLHGCPIDRRGWEWHYVKRLCHSERLSVEVAAGSISAITYSPDGRLIATSSGGHFSRGKGTSSIELWDRETGQRQPAFRRTENVIWSLAFSPDGTRLAVGGTNPQLEIRVVQTGETLWAKHEPRLPQAMSIAFSPDGKWLAAGFGQYSTGNAFQVTLFEVATGHTVGTFPGPRGGVNDLAFHPDGRRLAVAGSEVVEVWDVVAHARSHELRGHSKWVYGVAFSPDGKWLATGGWDRTIKLWDAATGVERLTIFGHEGFVLDLAFSPDSLALATTSEDRSVRLWEVPGSRQIGAFHGHTDFVQAVAFAPDGRELASGGLDGTMKVWDRRTSLPIVFHQHTGWVVRLAFRRDGRRVLSEAGAMRSKDETTLGWDPITGGVDPALTGIDPSQRGHEYLPPSSFRFRAPPQPVTSPDGRRLARVWGTGGTKRSQGHTNSTVVVLDVATGGVLHTLVGHTADVVGIAFSPGGDRIATASFDRTLKLWDTATGREVFTLRGHTAGLVALAFSPDGRRIVSGSIDFTARVWDATSLPAEVLREHEARYRQKDESLKALARTTEEAQQAQILARNGQWDLAAVAFARFVEQEPVNFMPRYPHIRALVEAGDKPGVRLACEDLLRRLANSPDGMQLTRVAWSCALTPDAVADPGAPVRLAEAFLASHPEESGSEKGAGLNTLGAALYRAGRYEEAIRRLNESVLALGGEGAPEGFAFLAMAHHRLGHQDQAQRWLDKLAAYQPKEGSDSFWEDVDIRILHREAETLIQGGRSTTPLTAPRRQPRTQAAPPSRP